MHVVKASAREAEAEAEAKAKAKDMLFSSRILEAKACPRGLRHWSDDDSTCDSKKTK
jgi:hypothetical protein